MKKAKSWLALPLAVCMFAVMIFSVAEAAETSDENPAEGRQEITIQYKSYNLAGHRRNAVI